MQGKLISILNGIYALLGLIISGIAVLSLSAGNNEQLLKFRELLYLFTENTTFLYILTVGMCIHCIISIAQAVLAFKHRNEKVIH